MPVRQRQDEPGHVASPGSSSFTYWRAPNVSIVRAPPQDNRSEKRVWPAANTNCGERGIEREQLERSTLDPAEPLDDISIVRSTSYDDATRLRCIPSFGKSHEQRIPVVQRRRHAVPCDAQREMLSCRQVGGHVHPFGAFFVPQLATNVNGGSFMTISASTKTSPLLGACTTRSLAT